MNLRASERLASSPIAAIIPHLLVAPIAAAPERRAAFHAIVRKHRIYLRLDSASEDLNAYATVERGIIRLPLGCAERLWAYVQAFTRILKSTEDQVHHTTDIRLDRTELERSSMRLLKWARDWDLRGARNPWPPDGPVPNAALRDPDLGHFVYSLYFRALGWILLHEIGHIVYDHGHYGSVASNLGVNAEHEADDFASDWMGLPHTGETRLERLEFAERSGAVVMALSVFAAMEAVLRSDAKGTHIDPPDRIMRFLTMRVRDSAPHDWAWWAAVSVLKASFDATSFWSPTTDHDSPHDCLKDMMIALKRHVPG